MASTSTLFSQPPQISRLVTHLTEAIHTGNSSWAKELVAEVLNNGLKLNVNVSKDQDSQRNKEKEFSLTVHVEDRLASGTTFELFVKSSDSVADLKRKVSVLHKIPTDLQRWIIGKKIPDGNTTLRNAGVSGPGHTLFLYVVTQQPVGPGMRDGSGNGREQQSRNSNNLESSLLSKIMSNNLSYEGQPKEVEFMLMSANTQSQASNRVSVVEVEVGETQGTPPPIPKRVPLQSAYDDDCEQTKVVSNPLMRVIPTASSKFSTSQKELEPQPKIEDKSGWTCPVCTYFNMPTRPGCEMCATSRPEGYVVPDNYQMTDKEVAMIVHQDELEKMTRQDHEMSLRQNYEQWRVLDDRDLISNTETFSCPICFDDFQPGEGVVLRDCLHQFCKECVQGAVMYSEEPTLICPYQDDDGSCDSVLQEREIRALVPEDVFIKYLQRGLDQAEAQAANSFHCKTTDCIGWCLYEDEVNFFRCPICKVENCLTCKVIHEGMNCKEYQTDLATKAINNDAARKTQDLIQKMVNNGSAMNCPQCQIFVQKKDGCDWIKCSVCKTEICWVTKGPRWGPKGAGDLTGGCQCGMGGRKCHQNCANCH